MALTPEDITQKSFTTRFRGIDPEEVTEFLKLAAAQLTEVQERLRQQSKKIGEQDKELELAADDDHGLAASIDRIEREAAAFFGFPPAS